MSQLTSRCTDSCSVARIGNNEEGLNEGSKGVNDVSEYLRGVLLHVVRLAERTAKGKDKLLSQMSSKIGLKGLLCVLL